MRLRAFSLFEGRAVRRRLGGSVLEIGRRSIWVEGMDMESRTEGYWDDNDERIRFYE